MKSNKTQGIVLSNKLLREYLLFRFKKEGYDYDLVKRIINYLKEDFFTNSKQLKELSAENEDTKEIILSSPQLKRVVNSRRDAKLTLEELCNKSIYKIILTDKEDSKDYPYVNINSDIIENNLCGYLHQNKSRVKAIQHIKNLCSSAKSIFIFDKYFNNNNSNIEIVDRILPNSKFTLKFIEKSNNTNDYNFNIDNYNVINQNRNGSVAKEELPGSFNRFHDRYIIIDNKIEIILTSGFEYLSNSQKELTYIVREIEESRFEQINR